MKDVDASLHPAAKARHAAVQGLSEEEATRPAHAYFAAFAWESSPLDPARLTAAAFFGMLDGR